MGGNAMKEYGVIRLNKEQFYETANDLLKTLRCKFPQVTVYPIKAFRDKETFGDLDLLYYTSDSSFLSLFKKSGIPKQYQNNGDCFSFVHQTKYGPFQVDLIKSDKQTVNFSFHYFNYNDLGNFLGRVFHKAGFKLGHTGLMYVIRDPDNSSMILKEIRVTRYWLDAMQFMGYGDYFNQSFNTVEDLFRFTLSSPYANKAIYLLENRNHKSRVRDRKRHNYSMMLKWISNPDHLCAEFDWSDKVARRAEFLQAAFDRWPNFKIEYNQAIEDYEIAKSRKDKFNGVLVREITGLEDKELGAFIKSIRIFFGDKFHDWLDSVDRNEIERIIRLYVEIYRGTEKWASL